MARIWQTKISSRFRTRSIVVVYKDNVKIMQMFVFVGHAVYYLRTALVLCYLKTFPPFSFGILGQFLFLWKTFKNVDLIFFFNLDNNFGQYFRTMRKCWNLLFLNWDYCWPLIKSLSMHWIFKCLIILNESVCFFFAEIFLVHILWPRCFAAAATTDAIC